MKNILRNILLVGLLFGYVSANNDWPFVCKLSELSAFKDKRYFGVGANRHSPLIIADSKTIQIDKKNKTIKVWTTWLASQEGRDDSIQSTGKYYNYNNFGYRKVMIIIDYGTLRFKKISTIEMNCDGTNITSVEMDDTLKQIVPGSVIERITYEIMKKYNLK